MGCRRSLLVVVMALGVAAASFAEDPPPAQPATPPVQEPAGNKGDPPPPRPNPIDDYTLAALNKLGDGWFVILLHKKDRSQRIRLRPNQESASGFEVVSVENPGSREARVQIEFKGQKGWVQFERKYLAVRKTVAEIPLERNYRINMDAIRHGHVRIVPTRRHQKKK